MIENDMPILKRLFILLDYCRKIQYKFDHSAEADKSLDDEEFIDTMWNKVSTLKIKLSFRYKNKDENALRYISSKYKLAGL